MPFYLQSILKLRSHFIVVFIALFLVACGGGGSNTKKSTAIDKIKTYAQSDGNPAPTLQDYIDAGVAGVTNENLDELNNVVKNLKAEDVDTASELEALTTQLNINITPTADAGPDKTVEINKSIIITGSGQDSDGTISSHQWKKGANVLANTPSFTYVPSAVGTDTLTLMVTDNDGATATDTMIVTVTKKPNSPPTADAGDNKTVRINTQVTITGNGTDTDGTISSFEWKKGDTVLSTEEAFNYIPTTVGTDTLTFTVTDNEGASATDSLDIIVTVNQAPTADAGSDIKALINQSIEITGSANDTDGNVASTEWKKDGTVLSTDTTFTYTPTTKGTDTLTLVVIDNEGAVTSDSIDILVGLEIPDSNRFLSFALTGKPDANDLNAGNEAIANAYYRTIDPNQKKNTLDKWYIENCFKPAPNGYSNPPNCGGDTGNHAFAIYLNNVDLNLGRRMAVRSNSDQVLGNANGSLQNTVSSCVENYGSIEDAINQTSMIAAVCMEYAPPYTNPNAKKFTKFFTYGPSGNRINKVDLDGRGEKYQPEMCLTCHGGNPGTLLPSLGNPLYSNEGDTESGFIPWDLNNFKFHATDPTLSKAAQEGEFKKFNQAALKTYETFDTIGTEGAQATRQLIRGWYNFSGNTIPENSTFNGAYTPDGWQDREALYHDIVVPSCRACHIQRGLKTAGPVDFANSADFLGFKNSIKTLIYDEGTMPLAKRTYDLFWDNLRTGNQAEKLWSELIFSGDIEVPGSPIPKISTIVIPDNIETVKQVTLDGRNSLFSEMYQWQILQSPAGAIFSFSNNTTSTPLLTLINNASFGKYKFKLTTQNTSGESASIESSLVNIDFTSSFSGNVVPIINDKCLSCHATFNQHAVVLGKVNLVTPANSSFLLKATQSVSHSGGQKFTVGSVEYNAIIKWIAQGALNN